MHSVNLFSTLQFAFRREADQVPPRKEYEITGRCDKTGYYGFVTGAAIFKCVNLAQPDMPEFRKWRSETLCARH